MLWLWKIFPPSPHENVMQNWTFGHLPVWGGKFYKLFVPLGLKKICLFDFQNIALCMNHSKKIELYEALKRWNYWMGKKSWAKVTSAHWELLSWFQAWLSCTPTGVPGVSKTHKNILQINLLSYCTNIQPILKKLQKTS